MRGERVAGGASAMLRGDDVKSALVWAALAVAVASAVLATDPGGSVGAEADADAARSPGHDARGCLPCRAIRGARRVRALPFEIDGGNVRVEPPRPQSESGAGTTR